MGHAVPRTVTTMYKAFPIRRVRWMITSYALSHKVEDNTGI